MSRSSSDDSSSREGFERRENPRFPFHDVIELQLASSAIHGQARNMSDAGVQLFTTENLRVNVVIQGPDGQLTVPGNVVRVEAVDRSRLAVSVRFEERVETDALVPQGHHSAT